MPAPEDEMLRELEQIAHTVLPHAASAAAPAGT